MAATIHPVNEITGHPKNARRVAFLSAEFIPPNITQQKPTNPTTKISENPYPDVMSDLTMLWMHCHMPICWGLFEVEGSFLLPISRSI